MAATHRAFSLWGAGHRLPPVSRNLHQRTLPATWLCSDEGGSWSQWPRTPLSRGARDPRQNRGPASAAEQNPESRPRARRRIHRPPGGPERGGRASAAGQAARGLGLRPPRETRGRTFTFPETQRAAPFQGESEAAGLRGKGLGFFVLFLFSENRKDDSPMWEDGV